MALNITCACGKRLRVDDQLAGQRVKCPRCSAVTRAPALKPVHEEPPAPVAKHASAPIKVAAAVRPLAADVPPGADRLGDLLLHVPAKDHSSAMIQFHLLFCLFLLLGLGMLTLGAWGLVVYEPFKSAAVMLMGVAILWKVGPVMPAAVVGIEMWLLQGRWKGAHLWVFSGGLAIATRRGHAVYTWNDFQSACLLCDDGDVAIARGRRSVIQLRTKQGRKVELDDHFDADQVWGAFLAEKLKAIVPVKAS
jgi:hypothetical protein